jgi:hypothetical protein
MKSPIFGDAFPDLITTTPHHHQKTATPRRYHAPALFPARSTGKQECRWIRIPAWESDAFPD